MRSKGSLSHECMRTSASSLILSNEASWLSTPVSSESATSSHASRISSASSSAARCLLASEPESASACLRFLPRGIVSGWRSTAGLSLYNGSP